MSARKKPHRPFKPKETQLRLPLHGEPLKGLKGYKRAQARKRFLKQFREQTPDFSKPFGEHAGFERHAQTLFFLASMQSFFTKRGNRIVEDKKAIERAKKHFADCSERALKHVLYKTPLNMQPSLLKQAYDFYSGLTTAGGLSMFRHNALKTAMPEIARLPREKQERCIEILSEITSEGAKTARERILAIRETLPKRERLKENIGPYAGKRIFMLVFGGVIFDSITQSTAMEKKLYRKGPKGFYVDKKELSRFAEHFKDQFLKRFSLVDLRIPSEEREYFYRGVIEFADITTRMARERIEKNKVNGIKKIDRVIKKEALSEIDLFVLDEVVRAEADLKICRALKIAARKRLASHKKEKH